MGTILDNFLANLSSASNKPGLPFSWICFPLAMEEISMQSMPGREVFLASMLVTQAKYENYNFSRPYNRSFSPFPVH
jgi:hypothetical protein